MRLYEIAEAYRYLADQLEAAETPDELREKIRDALESLAGNFEEKAANIAALISEYQATIDVCKKEVTRLTGKAARCENAIYYLKNYLFNEMKFSGLRKLKAGTFDISIARNGGKAPIVWDDDLDPETLPERFIRHDVTINTSEVREALEDGEVLDFAKLGERGESLRIK